MLGTFSCTCWPLIALEKCLLISSALFSVRFFFFFFWVVWALYMFGILTPYQIYDLQIFVFSILVFFHFWFCYWFPLLYWSFLVSGSFTCLFLLILPLLLMSNLKKKLLPKPMSRNLPPMFYSRNFMVQVLHSRLSNLNLFFCVV